MPIWPFKMKNSKETTSFPQPSVMIAVAEKVAETQPSESVGEDEIEVGLKMTATLEVPINSLPNQDIVLSDEDLKEQVENEILLISRLNLEDMDDFRLYIGNLKKIAENSEYAAAQLKLATRDYFRRCRLEAESGQRVGKPKEQSKDIIAVRFDAMEVSKATREIKSLINNYLSNFILEFEAQGGVTKDKAAMITVLDAVTSKKLPGVTKFTEPVFRHVYQSLGAEIMQQAADEKFHHEVEKLADELIEKDFSDRTKYLLEEEPLRKMAKFSPYAAEKIKELRKVLFERKRRSNLINGIEVETVDEVDIVAGEFFQREVIEAWYRALKEGPYRDRISTLSGDIWSRTAGFFGLSGYLVRWAGAQSRFSERLSAAEITVAAERAEAQLYIDLSRIEKFATERETTLLPSIRRTLALAKNKYGDLDLQGFVSEVREFCDYAISRIGTKGLPIGFAADMMAVWFLKRIEELRDADVAEENIPVDGFEFEIWCAEQLERQGWDIEATPKSGDQGVDIIVRRDGFTVAVQCKRYTSPIGNAAVQEIHAGRTFVGAKGAIVIGTGGFTKAAKSIATISKVELLDALDIPRFSEIFGYKSQVLAQPQSTFLKSEKYGQSEIIKMVLQGLPQVGELVGSDCKQRVSKSFDPKTGLGGCELSKGEAAEVLSTASVVLMSKISLSVEVRRQLILQDDVNKDLLSNPEVFEILAYQIYDVSHMEQVVEAFRKYVLQFSLSNINFAFLEEFE